MADQPTESRPGAESPYKGRSGLRRVINAFGYSMSGLAAAYRNEAAFRQELALFAAQQQSTRPPFHLVYYCFHYSTTTATITTNNGACGHVVANPVLKDAQWF